MTDRVPDQPCPKCGGTDTTMRYQPACGVPDCINSHREHFARGCRRCHHEWKTYDMLTIEEGTHPS
jgi:hypothetical protein